MRNVIYFLIFTLFLTSCGNNKVELKQNSENKVNTGSVITNKLKEIENTVTLGTGNLTKETIGEKQKLLNNQTSELENISEEDKKMSIESINKLGNGKVDSDFEEYLEKIGTKLESFQIDTNTFKILEQTKTNNNEIKSRISIDKNNLYSEYNGWPESTFKIKKIKDHTTYKFYEEILFGDGMALNYENIDEKGIIADINSIEKIGEGYFKDKDNYYYNYSNFQKDVLYKIGKNNLKLEILNEYVFKYNGNIFIEGSKLDNVDKSSFSILNDYSIGDGYNNLTFLAKDKNNLYYEICGVGCEGIEYINSDTNSFKVVNNYFDKDGKKLGSGYEFVAIDKENLFLILQIDGGFLNYKYNFDLETFEVHLNKFPDIEKENIYFTDKNGKYIIEGEKIKKI